jgi:hypothetical protein
VSSLDWGVDDRWPPFLHPIYIGAVPAICASIAASGHAPFPRPPPATRWAHRLDPDLPVRPPVSFSPPSAPPRACRAPTTGGPGPGRSPRWSVRQSDHVATAAKWPIGR